MDMNIFKRRQPAAASAHIPYYWPASQILGLIVGKQIESVPADKIVGMIVSDQIVSLAALKIEGKLTSEQIETIAATQITGELTDEQIAEIDAAKIIGQLTDSQLGGLAAAKIIGQLANGQIKSLEAGKITGQLTNAQIAALEAAKVTGQLTNAQIEGLSAAKITGLLTSEQINNLAVAKLVGQISGSQIAAGAVTAGKISVAELSAISASAGVITAGLFKGVTFETPEGDTKLDKEGLTLKTGTTEAPGNSRKINGVQGAKEVWEIFSTNLINFTTLWIRAWTNKTVEGPSGANIILQALWNEVKKTAIGIRAQENTGSIDLEVLGETLTLLDQSGKSAFLKNAGHLDRKVNVGSFTLEWPGGTRHANQKNINHGLGRLPLAVIIQMQEVSKGLENGYYCGGYTNTQFTASAYNTAVNEPAGTKRNFIFIAIG